MQKSKARHVPGFTDPKEVSISSPLTRRFQFGDDSETTVFAVFCLLYVHQLPFPGIGKARQRHWARWLSELELWLPSLVT